MLENLWREEIFYWPAVTMAEADFQDLTSKPEPSEEFLNDWLVRCCEIVDKYRPKVVYFDWWIHHSAVKPYLKKFAAYYYNRAARGGVMRSLIINMMLLCSGVLCLMWSGGSLRT